MISHLHLLHSWGNRHAPCLALFPSFQDGNNNTHLVGSLFRFCEGKHENSSPHRNGNVTVSLGIIQVRKPKLAICQRPPLPPEWAGLQANPVLQPCGRPHSSLGTWAHQGGGCRGVSASRLALTVSKHTRLKRLLLTLFAEHHQEGDRAEVCVQVRFFSGDPESGPPDSGGQPGEPSAAGQ